MTYKLKDLLDIPRLKNLLESFDEIHCMPSSIIDIEGNVLIANAWQDICTKFHRINSETEKKCIESDTHIKAELDRQSPDIIYRCPMGLVDSAVPLIIDGEHLGNVFTGQLFIEPPDEAQFIEQARRYGFDEQEYMAAVRKVPYFSEVHMRRNLDFIHKLTQMLAEQGLHHRQLHRAQDELARSVQIFRNLFEYSRDACLLFHNGKFINCNQAAVDSLHARSRAEVINTSPWDISPEYQPDGMLSRDKAVIVVNKVLADGSNRFEWIHRCIDDGFEFPVEVSLTALPDGVVYVMWHDISERKRNEEHLKQSEELFRNLTECMADWVWEVDAEGKYTHCSSQVEAVLGFSPAEIIGKSPFDFMTDAEAQRIIPLFSKIVAHKERIIDLENWNTAKDGRRVLLLTNSVPLFDKNNNVTGYRGIDRDITQRYRNNEIIRAKSHLMQFSLEHTVDELLEETLNAAERLTDSCIGFFHLVDDDQKTIKLQGWSSRTKSEFCGATPDAVHYEIGRAGVWVDCIHQRKPVIHNDYTSLSHRKGMPEGHPAVVRELVVPVFRGDRIKAILGIGNKASDYVEQDVEIISVFAELAFEIVERMHTEEELRLSQERFALAVAGSNDGIWDWNLQTDELYISPRWKNIIGYEDYELENHLKSFHENIHPDDLTEMRERLQSYLSGQISTYEAEFRMRHKDGSWRWILARGAAVREAEDGKPVRMAGSHTDITGQKLTAIELQNALLFNKHIIESAQEGIIVYDRELRYRLWNPYMERITGIMFQDLEGKTPHMFPFMVENGIVDDLQKVLEGESVASREFNDKVAGTGRDGWVIQSNAPLRDNNNEIIGVLGVVRDVTEQRKISEQLYQAQKMESIGQLAGGVAHDFNNMLSVILGHAGLALLRIDSTSPLHDDLEQIRTAAGRSADLTRQLLAFARKQAVSPVVMNLNETVSAMLKMLKRLIGEDIQLHFNADADLWQVMMDPAQVDQILANLCVNARDAIDDTGSITIESQNCIIGHNYCEVYPDACPGEYVMLRVTDDGRGMDEETLKHIFEPFYTTKEVGKGTGLGLATVFGIVSQNNGFMSVTSSPGQGATFSIYIPRIIGKESSARHEVAAEPLKKGSETILLVEDEPAILRVTSIMLLRQGYTVLTAATPTEAIKVSEGHTGTIHLLMTDVVMPEMSGKDLAQKIQVLKPGIKLLYMSGYTADMIGHRGVLGSDIHFIQKPFSLPDLTVKVRTVLD